MPHVNGAQATRAIHSRWPDVAIIAISTDYGPLAARMIAAGATAFVPKHAEPEALMQAVAAAAAKTRPKH
jgi:DNA-binding NarL/FixJ family response regulator